jgi:hypothetical protein
MSALRIASRRADEFRCGGSPAVPDPTVTGRNAKIRRYRIFFFAAFTFAHRALCAAAIFFPEGADITRFETLLPRCFVTQESI